MNIDIITYTDSQYAEMTETQILEVRRAQRQKDNLLARVEEKKRNEKYRLLKNGTFRSCLYDKICAQLDAERDADVARIREELLFYLRFVVKPNDDDSGAPYEVDYSLDYVERFNIVKKYYMDIYTSKDARLTALSKDSVAKEYLGEYYKTLYDYLSAV